MPVMLLPDIMYLFFSVSLCEACCVHIFKIMENEYFMECSQKPPIGHFYLSNWVILFSQLESFIFPDTPFLSPFSDLCYLPALFRPVFVKIHVFRAVAIINRGRIEMHFRNTGKDRKKNKHLTYQSAGECSCPFVFGRTATSFP